MSLMQGCAGSLGNPKAADPVDRMSSRVAAVACFFPPTDFLNYGKTGENAIGRGVLKDFKAPFMFTQFNPSTRAFEPITDENKIAAIGREISPVTHASADDPPVLIVHGDADKLVPIQQAEVLIEKLKKAGADAKLVVKPGASHGWADIEKDLDQFADWFDAKLKAKPADPSKKAETPTDESKSKGN